MRSRYGVLAILSVIACESRGTSHAPPKDAAAVAVPDGRVIDARPPCPGSPADCAACEAGTATSCTSVAYEATYPSDRADYYERGCGGGDPKGCEGLAHALAFGDGVAQDSRLAEHARRRQRELEAKEHARLVAQCDARDEDACSTVGSDLAYGKGVAKDEAASRTLLDASCARGGLASCATLFVQLEAKADKARYAKAACRLGEARICGDLVGVFGEPPVARGELGFARAQLERMCAANDATACWVDAGMYWSGLGARRKAAALLTRACSLEPKWCEDKDRFAKGEKFLADLPPMPTLHLPRDR